MQSWCEAESWGSTDRSSYVRVCVGTESCGQTGIGCCMMVRGGGSGQYLGAECSPVWRILDANIPECGSSTDISPRNLPLTSSMPGACEGCCPAKGKLTYS